MALIEFLVKVTAVVIVSFTLRWMLQKQNIHICMIVLYILCGLVGIVSDAAADLVPPLKDQVQLTALGQSGEGGLGTDVHLMNYIIDGEDYEIENAIEGKWLWLGNSYVWRNKADERQPEGITRTITVDMPVGYKRQIKFAPSDWHGLVQIKVGENVLLADTRGKEPVRILRSRFRMIAANVLWMGMIFAVIEMLFAGLLYAGFMIYYRQTLKEKYWYFFCLVCLAGLYLMMVIPSSGDQSFWVDEMYQVGYSGGDNSLTDSFCMQETTPPVYRVAANIWYHLVPYGEGWLLLLSELTVAASFIVMGYVGKVYRSKSTGIMTVILMMTSLFITQHCSYEFRSYSFLLLFSSALLLQFITRWKKDEHKTREFVLQWIWMLLLCYTHYFGLFLCMCVFVMDFVIVLLKENKIWKKFWFMYVFLGICYVPWVIRVIKIGHLEKTGIGLRVTIKSFYDILYAIADSNDFRFLMYIIAFVTIGMTAVLTWKKDQDVNVLINLSPVFVILLLFCGVGCYGIYINKNLTLWAGRYFTAAYPWIIIVVAVWIDKVVCYFKKLSKIFYYAIPMTIFLFWGITGMSNWYDFMQSPKPGQDYRNAANWLYDYNQGEIYQDHVAVAYLRTIAGNEGRGWYEYYITKQGQRDAPNFLSRTMELTYEDFEKFYEQYDVVFVCLMPYTLDMCEREWVQWIREKYELTETNDIYQIYVFRKTSNMES